MEKKAEAYKQYTGAALLEMVVGILPEMASKIAEPMRAIDSVNIYGSDGSGVTELSGNVPVMIQRVFDTVSEATGVDLKDIMRSGTIQAKTDRHIDMQGAIPTKEQ